MEISPARQQYLAAIEHVRTAWVGGCHCTVCISVDKRFSIPATGDRNAMPKEATAKQARRPLHP